MDFKGLIVGLALLLAVTLSVEGQQWVRITVRPGNAILTLDEQRMTLRDGRVEMLMAPGEHKYSVESPYYESVADTFVVKDSTRRELLIVMQPVYAYIDVRTGNEGAVIYVNQKQIGVGQTVSSRVTAGEQRLTVLAVQTEQAPSLQQQQTMCLYDGPLVVEKAEKKMVDVGALGVEPFPWDAARWLVPLSALRSDGSIDSVAMAEAHAAVEIGQCGVNVTSNVPGATILIDGKVMGNTPLVIPGLVAERRYLVTLRMKGFKDAHATFKAETGKVADVYLKMKK